MENYQNKATNNFEDECYYLIDDLLHNRPRDLENKVEKYSEYDRKKYISVIKENIKHLEEVKDKIDKAIYDFMITVYSKSLYLLENYKI